MMLSSGKPTVHRQGGNAVATPVEYAAPTFLKRWSHDIGEETVIAFLPGAARTDYFTYSLHFSFLRMAIYVFECVHVCGAARASVAGGIWPGKLDEGAMDQRTDEHIRKKITGTPKTQRREGKDKKSPKQFCRFDFFPSSMVTDQVEWWCLGRERR